jgi:hypothetical protein
VNTHAYKALGVGVAWSSKSLRQPAMHVGRLCLRFQNVLYMFIAGTYTGAWLRRENAAYS